MDHTIKITGVRLEHIGFCVFYDNKNTDAIDIECYAKNMHFSIKT